MRFQPEGHSSEKLQDAAGRLEPHGFGRPLAEVQREAFFSVADLLNLEVDLLLFDTTSTYFKIPAEAEDEFRRFGESKDQRPDLAQVVVGFMVTKVGLASTPSLRP